MAETYSWIARLHDVFAHLLERKARDLAFELADLSDGASVLEVAVGTGLNLPYVARDNPNGSYVGIDITPAMLDRARKRLSELSVSERYRLAEGDAFDLEFGNEAFDLLINSYMFDLLAERDFVPVLAEFERVLKPGGVLILINMTLGPRVYHHIWEWIYRTHPPLLGGCRGVYLQRFATDAGFEVMSRSFVSQWTFPSEVLLCRKPDSDHGSS